MSIIVLTFPSATVAVRYRISESSQTVGRDWSSDLDVWVNYGGMLPSGWVVELCIRPESEHEFESSPRRHTHMRIESEDLEPGLPTCAGLCPYCEEALRVHQGAVSPASPEATGSKSNWPRRYERVQVLIVFWKGEPDAYIGVKDVETTSGELYNYETRRVTIPTRNSEEALARDITKHLTAFDAYPNGLSIIFYRGHGGQACNGEAIWSKKGGPSVNWSWIQNRTVVPARHHVLQILDCCHAAAAAATEIDGCENQHWSKEVLAACAEDDKTDLWCFTHVVTGELKDTAATGGLTTDGIHRMLATRYEERVLRSKPCLGLLSKRREPSIRLEPLWQYDDGISDGAIEEFWEGVGAMYGHV